MRYICIDASHVFELVGSLALLLAGITRRLIRRRITRATGNLRGHLEKYLSEIVVVLVAPLWHHLESLLRTIDQVHDNSTTAVGSSVLGQVVASREFLAALVALERLLLSVEGAIVTLEMLLSAEAVIAQLADERLARVLGQ